MVGRPVQTRTGCRCVTILWSWRTICRLPRHPVWLGDTLLHLRLLSPHVVWPWLRVGAFCILLLPAAGGAGVFGAA
jgi:hypothetical protein